MKRKYALITAAVCLGVGLLLLLTALCLTGFDLSRLEAASLKARTMTLAEEIHTIEIHDIANDISIIPSPDGQCRVHYSESDTSSYLIQVQDGKLYIENQDTRKWYQRIGIQVSRPATLVVELPTEESVPYDALTVQTVSGDICVGDDLFFTQSTLNSTSGDIRFQARASGVLAAVDTTVMRLYAETVSGEICIACDDSGGYGSSIAVKSTSGDITLSGLRTDELSARTTSGDISVCNARVNSRATLQSVSGDLSMENVHMDTAALQSVSGDIHLVLLTLMDFDAQTTSGRIKLPGSNPTAGLCELTTTSGDIEVVLLKSN